MQGWNMWNLIKFTKKYILQLFNIIFTIIGCYFLLSLIFQLFHWHSYKTMPPIKSNEQKEKVLEFTEQLHKVLSWQGTLGIAEDNKTTYVSYGFAKNKKWSENTPSLIASISKSVTSYAILQLEEQKKLKITDNICKYLLDYCSPDIKNIKIYHLLNHISGINHGLIDNLFDRLYFAFNFASIEEQIESRIPLKTKVDPGKKFKYSNFSYILASKIISHVTQLSFEQAMQELVFDPLNLKDSFIFNDQSLQTIAEPSCHVFHPFFINFNCRFYGTAYENFYGAGGVVSTVNDLLKYGQALANKRIFLKGKVFSAAPGQEDLYSLGWVHFPNELYWHNGGTLGYHSEIFVQPEHDTTVVFLSNLNADPILRKSLNDFRKMMQGKEYSLPIRKNWIPRLKSWKDLKSFLF